MQLRFVFRFSTGFIRARYNNKIANHYEMRNFAKIRKYLAKPPLLQLRPQNSESDIFMILGARNPAIAESFIARYNVPIIYLELYQNYKQFFSYFKSIYYAEFEKVFAVILAHDRGKILDSGYVARYGSLEMLKTFVKYRKHNANYLISKDLVTGAVRNPDIAVIKFVHDLTTERTIASDIECGKAVNADVAKFYLQNFVKSDYIPKPGSYVVQMLYKNCSKKVESDWNFIYENIDGHMQKVTVKYKEHVQCIHYDLI